jgi:hypothetical protein
MTLIPKSVEAKGIMDYHPISLIRVVSASFSIRCQLIGCHRSFMSLCMSTKVHSSMDGSFRTISRWSKVLSSY